MARGSMRIGTAILFILAAGLAGEFVLAEGPAREDQAEENSTRETLEKLGTLGYTSWDPEADTEKMGVVRFDRERTSPGYNLFSNDKDKVLLTDLEGRLVHSWKLPHGSWKCELPFLLPDGDLYVVCVTQALLRVDWNGKVLRDVRLKVHHDLAVREDGVVLVPFFEKQIYNGVNVAFDILAFVSPEGKILDRWSTYENLAELRKHHEPLDPDRPDEKPLNPLPYSKTDYYHLNTVEILPETPLGKKDPRFRAGNILICLRNANLILILEPDDFGIVWSWGTEELQLPHHPTILPDGNILVFDNGTLRGSSRVLEVDPLSGEIVWKYVGDPPESFFSDRRGSNQRLPNGNTLITESERGRVFEVTREGEIVWEFWNPEFRAKKRKRIYRMQRLEPAFVEPLLKLSR